MGAFHVGCSIENHVHRKRTERATRALVYTGSEHTWISERTLQRIGGVPEKEEVAFIMPNGQTVTRSVECVVIRLGEHFTIDEVVFARKGDLQLLGARTLEGLNLRVDAGVKKLVSAGPPPVA